VLSAARQEAPSAAAVDQHSTLDGYRGALLACVAVVETEGVLVREPLAETLGVPVIELLGETVELDVAVAFCAEAGGEGAGQGCP
jgi:hypothetical protein